MEIEAIKLRNQLASKTGFRSGAFNIGARGVEGFKPSNYEFGEGAPIQSFIDKFAEILIDGIVYASDYNGGALTAATLNAAITAIGSDSTKLYLNDSYTIDADVDFSACPNLTVVHGPSCLLTQSASHTVTYGSEPIFQGIRQYFSGASGFIVFSKTMTVFPELWGATGSSYSTNDGPAIQAATDSLSVGGIVQFRNAQYASSIQLTLPSEDIIWHGNSADTTRIKYTGSTFQDFIVVGNDSDQTVNIKIRNLCLLGGDFLNGKCRFVLAAHWFNNGCELTNVQIREGVGLIRIQEAFYSQIADVYLTSTTPNRTLAGCTQGQWEEVHGDDRAPVMIMRANASDLRNIALYRVGSEVSGGVTPYAYCIITGQANSVVALAQSGCGTYTNGSTYNLRARYGKVLGNKTDGNGFVGNVLSDYVEDCDWTLAGVYSEERSHFSISPFWYKARCDGDLFYNSSAGDINVRDGLIYGGASSNLYHTLGSSGSLSESADVNFSNVTVLSGLRVTDGGLSGGGNNVFDTGGTSYLLGIADRGDRGTTLDRLVSPKKINGYTVTQGSDGTGAYILITSGWFLREDGKYVSNRHPSDTNAPVYQKIRPTTASKYYRVFVGRSGQPYLVQYNAAQTDPTGNWISEFATNGSIAITGLTDNVRVASYNGNYLPSGQYISYGSAVPTTGYWNRDDVFWITNASTTTSAFYRCVTAGAPGTWVAVDDFTAKSLTMVGLTLSGSLTFISSGIGASRIPFLDGSKAVATSSSLAWDGTTATIGSFKSSSSSSRVATGTSLAAGGSSNGLLFGSAPSLGIYFGSGAPSITAGKGSLYLRSDGSGTNDRAYINTDGGTTWTAIVTVA